MLRKFIALGAIASLFVVSVSFANPAINKPHKGKAGLVDVDGKDGPDKVTCVYCHDAKAANLPRTKGQDVKAAKTGKFCAGAACHK